MVNYVVFSILLSGHPVKPEFPLSIKPTAIYKNIIPTETYQLLKHPAATPQGDIVKNKTEITYY